MRAGARRRRREPGGAHARDDGAGRAAAGAARRSQAGRGHEEEDDEVEDDDYYHFTSADLRGDAPATRSRSPSPNTRDGVSDASEESFSIMSYSSELASRFSYVSDDNDDDRDQIGDRRMPRDASRGDNQAPGAGRPRNRSRPQRGRQGTPVFSQSATELSQPSTSLEDDASSSLLSSSISSSSSLSLSSTLSSMREKGPVRRSMLARFAVCLWHFLPLIILGTWSAFALIRYDQVFSQLSRSEVLEWREDGSVAVLHNRTIVFANGTLLFYNGSRKFPDGTWTHRKDVCYEDLAECAADRITPDTRSAIEAFLETKLVNAAAAAAAAAEDGTIEPFCGFATGRPFRSWSGMIQSEAPVLYPRNDSEVVDAIRAIGDAGCKIRPVGGRHSESGVSIDSFDLHAVGISLANYRAAPESGWALDDSPAARTRLTSEKTVRAEAGHTFLRLNSVIRPAGYHLPTLPETWALSLGGAVAGIVPGSTFGRSFVGTYARRLRVALADGRITEIADPLDLAMWRGSMGLHGLILGVEFEVEARKHFSMGARKTLVHEWNPWFLDAAVSALLPGAQGGQYMLDPWTDELLAVGFVTKRPRPRLYERLAGSAGPASQSSSRFQSDADCTFDVARLQCNFPEFCQYRFQFGDFMPAHSCRLRRRPDPNREAIREAYAGLRPLMDVGAAAGLPSAPGEEPSELAQTHWDLRLETAVLTAHESRALLNDGFWSLSAPRTVAMAYFFPVDKLFRALDILRTLVRELVIRNAPFTMRDAPVTFQFVRLEERSQVLLPRNAPVGDFVSIQMRVSPGKGDAAHAWRYALAELEQRWQLAFPDVAIFPNPGQVFGLHVFRTANATREEELKARYRRVRRVRDAFQTLKRHYEARMQDELRRRAPQAQSLSWFGSSASTYDPNQMYTFEDAYGIVDPSLAMLEQVRAELDGVELTEAEFRALHQEHDAARLAVDREDDHFGDINRELLQEAYAGDASRDLALLGSLPVPFMDPTVQRRMFSQAQMAAFLRYRQSVDPENRFWGGKATHLFPQKLKWSLSGPDDPDALAEAHLILDLKQSEIHAELAREARKNMVGTTVLVAMLCFGAFRIGNYICRGRRRRRSRRRGGRADSTSSTSSNDSSSSSSGGSTGSSVDSDSEGSSSASS